MNPHLGGGSGGPPGMPGAFGSVPWGNAAECPVLVFPVARLERRNFGNGGRQHALPASGVHRACPEVLGGLAAIRVAAIPERHIPRGIMQPGLGGAVIPAVCLPLVVILVDLRARRTLARHRRVRRTWREGPRRRWEYGSSFPGSRRHRYPGAPGGPYGGSSTTGSGSSGMGGPAGTAGMGGRFGMGGPPPMPDFPRFEFVYKCSHCRKEFSESESKGKTHCPSCGVAWINQGGIAGTFDKSAPESKSQWSASRSFLGLSGHYQAGNCGHRLPRITPLRWRGGTLAVAEEVSGRVADCRKNRGLLVHRADRCKSMQSEASNWSCRFKSCFPHS